MTGVRAVTAFIIFIICLTILSGCNISYEDAPDNIRTGIHRSLPPFTNIYHGDYFRFPVNNCDEPQCHGAVLSGGNSGAPSCYSCHGDRWMIFYDTHTLEIGGYFHQKDLNSVSSLISGCGGDNCHGAILEGVTGKGYRCKDCHNPVPAPAHNLNRDGVRHRSGTEASCGTAGCHGDPGRNGRLCSSCHD